METLFRIYDKFPPIIKKAISSIFHPLYSCWARVISFAAKARLPAYLLEGKEKNSGERVSVLIFAHKRAVNYFATLLYDAVPSTVFLGKAFLWRIESEARAFQDRADLTMVEAEGFFSGFLRRRGFILIPQWVLFGMDISNPLETIRKSLDNSSTHNNLRKIRKQGFTYEVTREPAKFELFYHKMYLPYAEKRFGESSVIISHRRMKYALENGWLLLVKKDEAVLGGIILRQRGKTCISHSLGVWDGNASYINLGVFSAAFYFTILWAKDMGFEQIDFGFCRPMLRDGILIHKKRWGMELQKRAGATGKAVFGIRLSAFGKGASFFLSENPLIYVHGEELSGLIYAPGEQPITSEELRSIVKIHDIKGLDRILIINPQGFTQEAQDWATSAFPQKLFLTDKPIEHFFNELMHQERLAD